ncbi:MAG: hypothetical protein ACQEQS_07770 [Thermodesulfobacteriota bacterium]
MKIASYNINQKTDYSFTEVEEFNTKIKSVFFGRPKTQDFKKGDQVEFSSNAKEKYTNFTSAAVENTTRINHPDSSETPDKKLVTEIISKASQIDASITEKNSFIKVSGDSQFDNNRIQRLENGLSVLFSHSRRIETNENTTVETLGSVKTEDGREINFGLHLQMERKFTAETSFESNTSVNKLIDPLVIQFDAGPPSLSDSFFDFDINTNGENEKLKAPGKGSGFLAFDINKDGKINDGTELFGTQSGNGFADLAVYDDDKNGWIDENDEIFSKLSVWRPETENEEEYMSGLLSADVGAIYLGYTQSSHTLTDDTGNTLAKLRSSGVFLKESGEASHIYQLDLADMNNETQNNQPERIPESESRTEMEELSKPDYFSGIRKKIEDFKEAMSKVKNENHETDFDKLNKHIQKRIDKLLGLLEGKKFSQENNGNPYKNNIKTDFEKLSLDI